LGKSDANHLARYLMGSRGWWNFIDILRMIIM